MLRFLFIIATTLLAGHTARAFSTAGVVDSYHASLSDERLFHRLSQQLVTLKGDLSLLKHKRGPSSSSSSAPTTGGGSGSKKKHGDYSFTGKKEYTVRPWHSAGGGGSRSSSTSAAAKKAAAAPPPPSSRSAATRAPPSSNSHNTPGATVNSPPAAAGGAADGAWSEDLPASTHTDSNVVWSGELPVAASAGGGAAGAVRSGRELQPAGGSAATTTIDSSSRVGTSGADDEDVRTQLQAVSAELQKISAENEALQRMQRRHEERERELQGQLSLQLTDRSRAERELEHVRAAAVAQLEETRRAAADRLAAETAEFQARLLDAERTVLQMKRVLELAEERLEARLLPDDDAARGYAGSATSTGGQEVAGGGSSPRNGGSAGKAKDTTKNTWGKVKDAFQSRLPHQNREETDNKRIGVDDVYGDGANGGANGGTAANDDGVNGLAGGGAVSGGVPKARERAVHSYAQPLPERPTYQISRVERM